MKTKPEKPSNPQDMPDISDLSMKEALEVLGITLEDVLSNPACDDNGVRLHFDPDESSLTYDDIFWKSRGRIRADGRKK